MADRQQSRNSDMDGSELTHEMLMDSYMVGTSDGAHQPAGNSIVAATESRDDADASGTAAAQRGADAD